MSDTRNKDELIEGALYLDCGCAIMPDGNRLWCASCAAETGEIAHTLVARQRAQDAPRNATELVETIAQLKRENAELRAAIHRHADRIQAALTRSELAAEAVEMLRQRLATVEAGLELLARRAVRRR